MTPKSLLEIQRQIQSSVQTGKAPASLTDVITENPSISIFERVRIYQDAYLIRKADSLLEDFEELAELISEEKLNSLIEDFIRKTPSTTRNLAEYSAGFPDFIQQTLPEHFEFVATLWMKILSSHLPETTSSMTQEQILSGEPFMICLAPSIITKQINEKFILVVCKDGEPRSYIIFAAQCELLDFLIPKRSLEEIEQYALQNNVSSELLIQTVFGWVRDGVVYCQSPSISITQRRKS